MARAILPGGGNHRDHAGRHRGGDDRDVDRPNPYRGLWGNYSLGGYATVTDGYHYATIAVAASAATGNWKAGKLFVQTQG